jgi:hypothetical protein
MIVGALTPVSLQFGSIAQSHRDRLENFGFHASSCFAFLFDTLSVVLNQAEATKGASMRPRFLKALWLYRKQRRLWPWHTPPEIYVGRSKGLRRRTAYLLGNIYDSGSGGHLHPASEPLLALQAKGETATVHYLLCSDSVKREKALKAKYDPPWNKLK